MKKTVTLLITILTSIALFTSCQDPIYSSIRKEVKLEKATILGEINNIVRFDLPDTTSVEKRDFIFLQNGAIYGKEANNSAHGAWKEFSSPAGSIIQLAADSKYLYALAVTYKEDTEEGENTLDSKTLYFSEDGNNWTKSSISNSGKTTATRLFCTNAIKNANRKAFIRVGEVVYSLDGTTANIMSLGADATKSLTKYTRTAAALGSKVYFFDAYAVTTNETHTTDADTYYYGNGKTLYYGGTVSGRSGNVSLDCGSIYSLALSDDSILLGTDSGISKVANNQSIPGKNTINFISNAASTLSSVYTIYALLTVSPELPETSSTHYASLTFKGTGSNSAQFSHIGLWSYYATRGNWNCE